MKPEHKIEEGDKVHVDINTAQITLLSEAVVLGIPRGPGDSWKFKDFNSDKVIYVSEGCTVTLLEKPERGKDIYGEELPF